MGIFIALDYGEKRTGVAVTDINKIIASGLTALSTKEVIPYLIRRADENTSVKGQTSRELDLIRTELKRRSVI